MRMRIIVGEGSTNVVRCTSCEPIEVPFYWAFKPTVIPVLLVGFLAFFFNFFKQIYFIIFGKKQPVIQVSLLFADLNRHQAYSNYGKTERIWQLS